jgi:hypothetical protein
MKTNIFNFITAKELRSIWKQLTPSEQLELAAPLRKEEIREINCKNGWCEFFEIGGPNDYAYGT